MTDFHDAQDLRRYRERKRKQQDYSAAYRAKMKKAKAPQVDDVRIAVAKAVFAVLASDIKALGPLPKRIIDLMVSDGFDREAVMGKIRSMLRKARTTAGNPL